MTDGSGKITTKTISVSKANACYRAALQVISAILLLIGTAGLVAYVVLGIVFKEEPAWVTAFLAFAIPFAVGFMGTFGVAHLNHAEKMSNMTSFCVFYADGFVYSSDGSAGKKEEFCNYSSCNLKGKKCGYWFLFDRKSGTFMQFYIKDLTALEVNTLKKLFNQPYDVAETLTLKNYGESDFDGTFGGVDLSE